MAIYNDLMIVEMGVSLYLGRGYKTRTKKSPCFYKSL